MSPQRGEAGCARKGGEVGWGVPANGESGCARKWGIGFLVYVLAVPAKVCPLILVRISNEN